MNQQSGGGGGGSGNPINNDSQVILKSLDFFH